MTKHEIKINQNYQVEVLQTKKLRGYKILDRTRELLLKTAEGDTDDMFPKVWLLSNSG